MYQLVYVSSAVIPFTNEQLTGLLDISRHKNAARAITGMLLYVSGNFIQLLEGAKEDVLAIYASITEDPRHRGLITLLEGECDHRDFKDWSMGFQKVGESDAEKLPGYSDFLKESADPAAKRSGALQLLKFFKELNC